MGKRETTRSGQGLLERCLKAHAKLHWVQVTVSCDFLRKSAENCNFKTLEIATADENQQTAAKNCRQFLVWACNLARHLQESPGPFRPGTPTSLRERNLSLRSLNTVSFETPATVLRLYSLNWHFYEIPEAGRPWRLSRRLFGGPKGPGDSCKAEQEGGRQNIPKSKTSRGWPRPWKPFLETLRKWFLKGTTERDSGDL